MQTSKRILTTVFVFLFLLIVLSAAIIEPMIQCGLTYYCDGNYRDYSAGNYQMLFVGDSDGLASIMPLRFEDISGIMSYNLCQEKNTWESEAYLLRKECSRNNIEEVIVQVGIDSFTRDYDEEHSEGNAVTVMRVTNIFERMSFLAQYVSMDGWLDVYSNLLTRGMLCWIRNLTGDIESNFNPEFRGWHKLTANNIMLTKEDAAKSFNTEKVETSFRQDRIEGFISILDYCKQHGIKVTVIFVPMADAYIWKKTDLSILSERIKSICIENTVNYIDFNLYKERYTLFSDKSSYKDNIHMSSEGAEQFTYILAETLKELNMGKSIDYMFYNDYETMKSDSPYIQLIH